MEPRTINEADYAHIPGWGIDADPENDPTYPMKHWTGDDHQRLGWERPPLQPVDVEVLQSIEYPRLTAVFGNTAPPKGLSGMIRRYAFKYSESHYGHWLPLIVADRVGVVEGIIDDFRHGHVPNIFAEKGWKAGWKHDKAGIITKVAVTIAVTAAVVVWLRGRKEHRLEA